jgi:hypothetical protein
MLAPSAKKLGRLSLVACALVLSAGSLVSTARPAGADQLHPCWGYWSCKLHGQYLVRTGHADADEWKIVVLDGARYIYH